MVAVDADRWASALGRPVDVGAVVVAVDDVTADSVTDVLPDRGVFKGEFPDEYASVVVVAQKVRRSTALRRRA